MAGIENWNYDPGFSLKNDGSGGWAYAVDIKPAAQYLLSKEINLPVGSATEKIRTLETYYFYMNELGQQFGWDRPEEFGGVQPKRIGLIAQELAAVEPSLVRIMDWLGEDEDYYWIDYEALSVLCLDALNELNARAEAVKAQLGMPAETYPTPVATTTITEVLPTNYQLSVTPAISPEGTSSTWTLTADNVPDGTIVSFYLLGTANIWDVTADESAGLVANSWQDILDVRAQAEADGYVGLADYEPSTMGWAFGKFVFTNGQAQVTLNYVLDTEKEEDETIIMTLNNIDSNNKGVPVLTATATLTDV